MLRRPQFEGGPNPWLYEPAAYFERITPSVPSSVHIEKIGTTATRQIYQVSYIATKLVEVED
jgi:hypothetical protein